MWARNKTFHNAQNLGITTLWLDQKLPNTRDLPTRLHKQRGERCMTKKQTCLFSFQNTIFVTSEYRPNLNPKNQGQANEGKHYKSSFLLVSPSQFHSTKLIFSWDERARRLYKGITKPCEKQINVKFPFYNQNALHLLA